MFESDSLNYIDNNTLNDVEIMSLDSNKQKYNEISKTKSTQLKLNFDLTKSFAQNQQQDKLGVRLEPVGSGL
jgi:hypothetical protein